MKLILFIASYVNSLQFGQLYLQNENQKHYANKLKSDSKVVVVEGASASGKSLIACQYAVNQIRKGTFDKVLFTAATDSKKLVLHEETFSKCGLSSYQLDEYEKKGLLLPIELDRIYTMMENTLLVADDMHFSTEKEMRHILTKVGFGSKVIISGNLLYADDEKNGLSDLITRMNHPYENEIYDVFDFINMTPDDSVLEVPKITYKMFSDKNLIMRKFMNEQRERRNKEENRF